MFMQIAYKEDGSKYILQFSDYSLGNHMPHDIDAYINFDRSGYAPDRVFGIANVTATSATGKTSAFFYAKTKDNILQFKATDLVLEAEGVTFTANADGTYNYTITATESATIPVTVKNVAGHVLGSFNIDYTAPEVA